MFLSLSIASVEAAGGIGASGTGAGAGAGVSAGGHAGAVGAGTAHVSAPAVSRGSIGTSPGLGGGLRSTSSLHPITASYHGPAHYLPGGFAPNVISHAPSVSTGFQRPAAASALVRGDTAAARLMPNTVPAQVHNAWSDPSTSGTQARQATNGVGYGPNAVGAINRVENQRGNNFSGTVLYPDALPDSPGSRFGSGPVNSTGSYGRSHFYGGRYGRNYGNFVYAYPYLFSGGYAPYVDSDIGGFSGALETAGPVAGEGSNALSADAVNDLSRPYPDNSYVLSTAGDSTTQPQNPSPSANNATSQTDNQNLRSNTGPDSLVEAVQAELARRGYFGGKVDAVYNEATHAAIQRFQNDQHLPATGRVNEATLHALELD